MARITQKNKVLNHLKKVQNKNSHESTILKQKIEKEFNGSSEKLFLSLNISSPAIRSFASIVLSNLFVKILYLLILPSFDDFRCIFCISF